MLSASCFASAKYDSEKEKENEKKKGMKNKNQTPNNNEHIIKLAAWLNGNPDLTTCRIVSSIQV